MSSSNYPRCLYCSGSGRHDIARIPSDRLVYCRFARPIYQQQQQQKNNERKALLIVNAISSYDGDAVNRVFYDYATSSCELLSKTNE